MIPAVGQKVGPYEILGRLGSGGMGLVYSAWDSRLQRDVAIKLLHEEFSSHDMRERFLQEARAASSLNHPNICTVFDIGEQNGDPYLVMELLKGETLRHRMSAGAMLPQDILQVGTEIADALAAAHVRGVIHRDIKPANIFLVAMPNDSWQTKVLDFGLAKVDLADAHDARFHLTGDGVTVGTVSYMSPEQARGEALDARSDLFALGIILYEMASGHVPFQGATSALVFVQLLSHPAKPLRDLNPSIPKDLERVIAKLLAKDLDVRYQSASEVAEALRAVTLRKSGATRHRIIGLSAWGRGRNVALPTPAAEIPPDSPTLVDKARLSDAQLPLERPGSVPGNSLIRPVRRVEKGGVVLWGQNTQFPQPTTFVDPSGKPSGRRPAEFSYDSRTDEDQITLSRAKVSRSSIWVICVGAVISAGALVGGLHLAGNRQEPTVRAVHKLVLGSVLNQTGDKTLDGVIVETLRLDLAQSPQLLVPGSAEIAARMRAANLTGIEPATPSEAQIVAAADGATSFLFGTIRRVADTYVIDVRLYDSSTLALLMQDEETAASRNQIHDSVDRIAAKIRLRLEQVQSQSTARLNVETARLCESCRAVVDIPRL